MEIGVKVCGITRAEDAALAIDLGAMALGFVLWPKSPRVVSIAAARRIAETVPASVLRVGVFVNAGVDDVAAALRDASLDVAQLHGDEAVAPYLDAGLRVIRAVPLTSEADVEAASALPAAVTTLVDAADVIRRGGTGARANWTLAAGLAARRPVMLAGGLRPENVAEAVRAVRPFAIDVSSGVEARPGIKDEARLRALVAAVRAAEGVVS